MKKFQFSLERVRGYREQILDQEKGKLLKKKNEKEVIDRKIRKLREEFQTISQMMIREQQEGTSILQLRAKSSQLSNIRQQLKQLCFEAENKQREIDVQMRAVVTASQEVSKLDKLEDRQIEVYQKSISHAQALEMEELVVTDLTRNKAM